MAAPVIDPTQSILGYLQFQTWAFQPAASNSPASWTCTTLPSGLTFNTGTGKITGAVAVPGVYDFILTATNGSGTSQPVSFCFAIEASGGSAGTDLDLEFDIESLQVTRPSVAPAEVAAGAVAPLFKARLLDKKIVSVRLVKNGVTVDLTPTAVKFGATDEAGDAVLVTSGDHHKQGSGDAARYRVPIEFTGNGLSGAVENDEVPAADGTALKQRLLAICDLKVEFANPDSGTFGPAALRIGSDTFIVELSKNVVP